jgi:hypothetical protein
MAVTIRSGPGGEERAEVASIEVAAPVLSSLWQRMHPFCWKIRRPVWGLPTRTLLHRER